MAIKVIRICDMCDEKYEQIIDKKEINYTVDFMCSDCFLAIDKLTDLMMKENNGNGVSCICSIISCLNAQCVDMAKRVYKNEGDKIRSYPKIQDWLYKYLGCRGHFIINCQSNLCRQLQEYNDRDIRELNIPDN